MASSQFKLFLKGHDELEIIFQVDAMRRALNMNICSTKANKSVSNPALSQGDPKEIIQSHHAVQISPLILSPNSSLDLA